MDIKDIANRQFLDMLERFKIGQETISAPVAFAFTGDATELAKLDAVDFSKLRVEQHSACDPDRVEALDWVETKTLSDGLAICFEGGPVDTTSVTLNVN